MRLVLQSEERGKQVGGHEEQGRENARDSQTCVRYAQSEEKMDEQAKSRRNREIRGDVHRIQQKPQRTIRESYVAAVSETAVRQVVHGIKRGRIESGLQRQIISRECEKKKKQQCREQNDGPAPRAEIKRAGQLAVHTHVLVLHAYAFGTKRVTDPKEA